MGKILNTKKHRRFVFIGGFARILDGLVIIFTLARYCPDFTLRWSMYMHSLRLERERAAKEKLINTQN